MKGGRAGQDGTGQDRQRKTHLDLRGKTNGLTIIAQAKMTPSGDKKPIESDIVLS